MNNLFSIGDYVDHLETSGKVLKMNIKPVDVIDSWSRCDMISNFTAHYFTADFQNRNSIYNSLSVILYELIENAIKFTSEKEKPISVSLVENSGKIIIEIINYINKEEIDDFKKLAESLIDNNVVNRNYMKKVTALAGSENVSSIGLVTLINYYNVNFSFQINGPEESDLYKIYIQTRINIEELFL